MHEASSTSRALFAPSATWGCSLFGDSAVDAAFEERPEIPAIEFDQSEQLAFEKEMLGLYVSDHPLMGAEAELRRRTDCPPTNCPSGRGRPVRCGGVVTNLQRKWTRRGTSWRSSSSRTSTPRK